MSSRSKLLTTVALLFLLHLSVLWTDAVNGDLTNVSLTEAEEALASSYEAVLAAEQAGANVSDLLNQFNVGCEYLSQAHVLNRSSNPENSSYFSGLCFEIAERVQNDASTLRDEAKRLADNNFVTTAFVSVIAIICVIILSFFSWHVFKRLYLKKILGMKPEVIIVDEP